MQGPGKLTFCLTVPSASSKIKVADGSASCCCCCVLSASERAGVEGVEAARLGDDLLGLMLMRPSVERSILLSLEEECRKDGRVRE